MEADEEGSCDQSLTSDKGGKKRELHVHSEQLCQFDTFLQPSVKLSETIVFIPPRLEDPRWCVIHTRVGQDGRRSVDKHTPGGCFQAV